MALKFVILNLHLLFLLFTHSATTPPSSLNPLDLESLQEIKNSLQDLPGSNFLSTWDFASPFSDPCTSFAGILCSIDRKGVQSLTLGTGLADTPGLTGKLSPAIGNLTYLLEFIVYAGNISGSIPPEIGDLEHLQLLSITKNRISGEIPLSVTNLKSLHTLDLGYNRLQGSLPQNLMSLPELKVLILAGNCFSGRIPAISPSPSPSSQLFHLDLRSNLFWGPLPDHLPSSLRYLSVSQNRLWGPISNLMAPASSDLSFLDLSMNCFSGVIPGFLFGNRRLSTLLLQRNCFSGVIPGGQGGGGVGGVGSIVDLSHNNLSGEITTVLTEVENVYLNNNRFTGMVPVEYVRAVYGGTMKTLYLQHNYLSGFPLPGGGAPPPGPTSLCISYNCMVPPLRLACPASAGGRQSRPFYQCSVFNNSTID